jgi:hypothetical protein
MRSFLFAALLLTLFPAQLIARAASTDVYGDSVYAHSPIGVLTSENAAGAPDEHYADYRDENAYITIDMGAGEEGIGDLILTVKQFDINARVNVMFYDADMNLLSSAGNTLTIGSTTDIVEYAGEGEYRYVKITSTSDKEWSLDAVQATQVETPDESAPTPCSDCTGDIPYEEDIRGDVAAGTLIKTSQSSSVYLLGTDGKRHAFPNENIFTSWGYSFDDVQTISLSDMASYMLGKNVTVRPGTWLVKIPFDKKVYAVGEGGKLSWIRSEAQAEMFYGKSWNKRVLDVSEVFWKNYTLGGESSDQYISGTIFEDGNSYYYETSAGARLLAPEVRDILRINYGFAVTRTVPSSEIVAANSSNADLLAFYHPF